MGNVPPAPFPIFSAKAHADATNEWVQSAFPTGITDFITVSLMKPKSGVDPSKWNTSTSSERQDLPRDMIWRMDRQVHGACHKKMESFKKFDFLILEETRDVFGNTVFAHFHAALALSESQRKDFLDGWPKIQRNIERLVRKRGFDPDIWLQDADDGVSKYIAKNACTEVQSILTRAIMYK